MPLTAPMLDDRHFQDIVDEAKKRIPQYCKEWTDHNVSDPGVTMIELFAWMTDMLLYRLNQVPDLHYVKFLEMLGIQLKSPEPARSLVDFWLSAPQARVMVIPAMTEVASTQTERERSIIFSTDTDFAIHPPQWVQVLSRMTSRDGKKGYLKHNQRRLEAGFEGMEIFTSQPQVDDALYFGFENDLSQHILGFQCEFDNAGGAGIDPSLPPYVWEASSAEGDSHWQPCSIAVDETKGMNVPGRIQIHLPKMGKYAVNQQNLFWVRVRVLEISPLQAEAGMQPYQKSPRLQKISLASWGASIACTHAQTVTMEHLGQSDGTPGQKFTLQHTPILARLPDEHLLVKSNDDLLEEWQEAVDFSSSGANDRHYLLDSTSGELRFGPAVRLQDGTIKLYGAVPPRKSVLLFARYRHGGGEVGNVQPGILNTLKTSIPYISRIHNRFSANGGLDAETLEAAKMRAPAMLRSRDRAVTEADFEFLAHQAAPAQIGRVRCLQPQFTDGGRIVQGQIYVLIIPRVNHPEAYIEPEQLELSVDLIKILANYLDQRRLLTTQLKYQAPAYQWVSMHVKLRQAPGVDPVALERDVLARLYHYLNPLSGGNDGKGWEFGRNLFVSDVYQCLQGMPGIQFIRSLEMYKAEPAAASKGKPLEEIEILAHGVIASALHQIEFV